MRLEIYLLAPYTLSTFAILIQEILFDFLYTVNSILSCKHIHYFMLRS